MCKQLGLRIAAPEALRMVTIIDRAIVSSYDEVKTQNRNRNAFRSRDKQQTPRKCLLS
jgi:hypothetical protein